MRKKVALVELSHSHEECLYAQILFLKEAGHEVHLVISTSVASRTQPAGEDARLVLNMDSGAYLKIFQALHYIRKCAIRNIVINTASGNYVRLLVFLLGRGRHITGILHNAKKLLKSSSQRWISRYVRTYFVLNDYILKNISPQRSELKFESLYLNFFPKTQVKEIKKDADSFWICIPGAMEVKRRDYWSLFENLLRHPASSNIKFILLGRIYKHYQEELDLLKRIEENHLSDRFITFDGFIDNETYFAYIRRSEVIMPLIHIEKPQYREYGTHKVSGAFNLAFAFQKALLMDKGWQGYDDFKDVSFFYEEPAMIKTIENITRDDIRQKEKAYESNKKFSFIFQSTHYNTFVCK